MMIVEDCKILISRDISYPVHNCRGDCVSIIIPFSTVKSDLLNIKQVSWNKETSILYLSFTFPECLNSLIIWEYFNEHIIWKNCMRKADPKSALTIYFQHQALLPSIFWTIITWGEYYSSGIPSVSLLREKLNTLSHFDVLRRGK